MNSSTVFALPKAAGFTQRLCEQAPPPVTESTPSADTMAGMQLKVLLFLSRIVAKDDLFFNSRSKSNVPSAVSLHRIINCIPTMIYLFGFTNRVEKLIIKFSSNQK